MSATHPLTLGIPRGACPERPEEHLSKFDVFGEQIGRRARQSFERFRKPWSKVPAQVEAQAAGLAEQTDAELRVAAEEVRVSLQRDGFVDDAVARAFALVREASSRVLEQRHYDVQLMGGWVMLNGMVAEMETGEGKTLVATLPACTAALAGVPVHVVTVNDYLTERDAALMQPLYEFLGLSVGTVLSSMETAERREAYRCDITYCTNSQLVFDYLWDRITLEDHGNRRRLQIERLSGRNRSDELIQQGLHFAIVDEADSVLVDEARTPLIISERGEDELEQKIYTIAVELARELERVGRHSQAVAGRIARRFRVTAECPEGEPCGDRTATRRFDPSPSEHPTTSRPAINLGRRQAYSSSAGRWTGRTRRANAVRL